MKRRIAVRPLKVIAFAVWIITATVFLRAADGEVVIRGHVAILDGQPIKGVLVESTPELPECRTDHAGEYEIQIPVGVKNLTLTPSKQGYVFNPCQAEVDITSGDAQSDFTAIVIASVASRDASVQRVATPTFDKTKGRYFGNVTVTVSCATTGASVYYTTDGSEPKASSTQYNAPITLIKNTTLKAKAFKSGLPDSGVMAVKYAIVNKLATPVFSQVSGAYYASVQVKISCATTGATIHYTTDGSEPTSASPAYTAALTLTSATTLSARAFLGGTPDSKVATAKYSIIAQVAPLTISPTSGTIGYDSVKVTLTCGTAGATIRYTTDGTEPSASAPAYTAALTLTQSAMLNAKAFKTGLKDSDVVSAIYTLLSEVAPPTYSAASGPLYGPTLVKISCATAGATICYTTDGSLPTSSSTVYNNGVNITAKMTLMAQAFKNGLKASEVVEAQYTVISEVAQPQISPASGRFNGGVAKATITCATTGAAIYYTTDGSEPTTASSAYSSALTFTQTTTLKAKAFKNGLKDSEETVVKYVFLQ